MGKIFYTLTIMLAYISFSFADYPTKEIFDRYHRNVTNEYGKLRENSKLDFNAASETIHMFFLEYNDSEGNKYEGREATADEYKLGRMGFYVEALRLQTKVLAETGKLSKISSLFKNIKGSMKQASDAYKDHFIMSAKVMQGALKEVFTIPASLRSSLDNIANYDVGYDFTHDVKELLEDKNAKGYYSQLKKLHEASRHGADDFNNFIIPVDMVYNTLTIEDLKAFADDFKVRKGDIGEVVMRVKSTEQIKRMENLANNGVLSDINNHIEVFEIKEKAANGTEFENFNLIPEGIKKLKVENKLSILDLEKLLARAANIDSLTELSMTAIFDPYNMDFSPLKNLKALSIVVLKKNYQASIISKLPKGLSSLYIEQKTDAISIPEIRKFLENLDPESGTTILIASQNVALAGEFGINETDIEKSTGIHELNNGRKFEVTYKKGIYKFKPVKYSNYLF